MNEKKRIHGLGRNYVNTLGDKQRARVKKIVLRCLEILKRIRPVCLELFIIYIYEIV